METRGAHMDHAPPTGGDELHRLRELAEQIDCFCEPDFRTLTGWTEGTTEARRKRGDGPPYILIGKNYFYPKRAAVAHFQGRTRVRRVVRAVEVL